MQSEAGAGRLVVRIPEVSGRHFGELTLISTIPPVQQYRRNRFMEAVHVVRLGPDILFTSGAADAGLDRASKGTADSI